MISAKKAREMIESVEHNKEALESTFGHIEKRIIGACDKKEYTCQLNLSDPNIAYDIKLCVGNPALRKHIVKKLEKNGFKSKFVDNIFEISWAEDDEDNTQEPEFSVEVPKSIQNSGIWNMTDNERHEKALKAVDKIIDEMELKKTTIPTQKTSIKPASKTPKVALESNSSISTDGVDFSEFNDVIKYNV